MPLDRLSNDRARPTTGALNRDIHGMFPSRPPVTCTNLEVLKRSVSTESHL